MLLLKVSPFFISLSEMGKTAVVILNWNGKHFLEKFVPLLKERTPESLGSLFVADNGSTDDSVSWLKSSSPYVHLIEFDKNYGFTGGYNKAFEIISKEGDFDYYLLLNSDVEVTRGWLDTLVLFMDSHPRAGVCSPKVLSWDNRDYFEHAGACGGMLDRYGFPYCRGRVLDKIEKDYGQYDRECEVFWASGTSFMVRSQLWHQLGGLDNSFFAHMEEIDFCWRAKLLGREVWVVPQVSVYHVGGGALPNNSPFKLYLNFRNNLLMLYKNLPLTSRGRIIFVRMCLDGAAAAIYLLKGQLSFFRAVKDAHRDYRKMKKSVIHSQELTPVPRSSRMILLG